MTKTSSWRDKNVHIICFIPAVCFQIFWRPEIFFQSLNIPMSGKAVDKLMKKLDVDDDGEIDFA